MSKDALSLGAGGCVDEATGIVVTPYDVDFYVNPATGECQMTVRSADRPDIILRVETLLLHQWFAKAAWATFRSQN